VNIAHSSLFVGKTSMSISVQGYLSKAIKSTTPMVEQNLVKLVEALSIAWDEDRSVYLCGNGGSAANAIHLANDFLYGVGVRKGRGLRVEALSANPAVVTCLANDLGYEHIFSAQLHVKGASGDVLIALSGSGNSPNIIKAIERANAIGMKTFAILGFSGGKCKDLAQTSLHFPVDDMQIAEDLQTVVGHICMQRLLSESYHEELV
jgi:D-sedoheptulose 7-phosphate isomerase